MMEKVLSDMHCHVLFEKDHFTVKFAEDLLFGNFRAARETGKGTENDGEVN